MASRWWRLSWMTAAGPQPRRTSNAGWLENGAAIYHSPGGRGTCNRLVTELFNSFDALAGVYGLPRTFAAGLQACADARFAPRDVAQLSDRHSYKAASVGPHLVRHLVHAGVAHSPCADRRAPALPFACGVPCARACRPSTPGACPPGIGISALAARGDLDPADDVSVRIHHVGLAPGLTDGLDRPGADPPTREIGDELIQVADRDGHYGSSSALRILDHVEPAVPSHASHDLVRIGNHVGRASEELFIPAHRRE